MPRVKTPEEIQQENTDIVETSLSFQQEQLEVFKDIAGFLESIAASLEQLVELMGEEEEG